MHIHVLKSAFKATLASSSVEDVDGVEVGAFEGKRAW